MPTYRVRWEIDIDADSPEQAACIAQMIQRDVDSEADHFDLTWIDASGQFNEASVNANERGGTYQCEKCCEMFAASGRITVPILCERCDP